jgi:hypothetical protein
MRHRYHQTHAQESRGLDPMADCGSVHLSPLGPGHGMVVAPWGFSIEWAA